MTPTSVFQELGVEMKGDEKRITSARCVYLMSVAMANDLDEVWLSGHPELFYLYLFQYFPTITRRYVVNDFPIHVCTSQSLSNECLG